MLMDLEECHEHMNLLVSHCKALGILSTGKRFNTPDLYYYMYKYKGFSDFVRHEEGMPSMRCKSERAIDNTAKCFSVFLAPDICHLSPLA